MLKIFLISIALLTSQIKAQPRSVRATCEKFDRLNTAILNNTINHADARIQVKALLDAIKSQSELKPLPAPWVFPLARYNYQATGGSGGNGYIGKGYNYFDGNKHGGHPAHDIFIDDRNQDCIDDKTHLPVKVLAVADGIVIACCNTWETSSKMRGGKYIWIYHPQLNLITYYAHNESIFVKPGDKVKAGQQIALVGRTGYNAYKKRSPTHLHFSSFHIVDGKPVPFNGYKQLKNAKTS
jgi:hypothetical protein